MKDAPTTELAAVLPDQLAAFTETTNLTALMLGGGPQFEHIQRVANLFAKSDLVPEQFRGKIGNCIIALEIAQRMGAGALPVMQNLYIVHGKPGWSSQFLIACLNTCGRFEPLRFDVTGTGDDRTCVAWTTDKGARLTAGVNTLEKARQAGIGIYESPPVSIKMSKEEGWHGKNGSKWKTMPELMLRYRAATFFTRLYAPEIAMGMQTTEEIQDVRDITPPATAEPPPFLSPTFAKPSTKTEPVPQPASYHDGLMPEDAPEGWDADEAGKGVAK